jgi:hypothetical protein
VRQRAITTRFEYDVFKKVKTRCWVVVVEFSNIEHRESLNGRMYYYYVYGKVM